MQTISEEEFKKRYGTTGLSMISKPTVTSPSFGDRLKQAASQGVNQIKSASKDINSGNPLKFIEGSLKAGAGAVNTLFSPVSAATEPIIKPTVGKAVNYVADKISNNQKVQQFATSKIGELTSRITEDLNNLNTIASAITVPNASKAVVGSAGKIGNIADHIPTPNLTGLTEGAQPALSAARNIAKDISPTYKSIINDQVTKAFELTPNDVKNISRSTGNEVGDFVAKHDLIGNTVDSSKSLLNDFYKENYGAVRNEIQKVPTIYKKSQVPRFTEALTELKKQTADVPGLQQSGSEIDTLLKKKNISLSDTQRAKELIDKHVSLYKATGDVKEGIAKQGWDNIRKDLRSFIEEEVKTHSGTDIAELNNNVATARSILDAIKNRAGRPTTRAQISLTDLGWFGGGSVVGTPLLGVAAVFAKKVLESPSVRLRIAKFIKGLSEAKQLKIQNELKAGTIPKDLKQFVKAKLPATVKTNPK